MLAGSPDGGHTPAFSPVGNISSTQEENLSEGLDAESQPAGMSSGFFFRSWVPPGVLWEDIWIFF